MTEQDWELLLDREPANWEARRMYAVWLQDEQDDLLHAGLQNWLANSEKCPHKMQIPAWDEKAPYFWTWWDSTFFGEGIVVVPRTSHLPGCIYGLVSLVTPQPVHRDVFDRFEVTIDQCREFATRNGAEEVLISPLVKLGSISSFSLLLPIPAGTKMIRTPAGYFRPAEKFEECDASFILIEDSVPGQQRLKVLDLRLQPNVR